METHHNEASPKRNMPVGAAAVGAATAVATALMLTLLGGGFGLIAWEDFARLDFDRFFPGTAFKTVLLAFGSFLAGGYAAARYGNFSSRASGGWSGLGAWGIATSVVALVLAPVVISTVPMAGLGTKPGVDALVETVESMRPRIVSDMSILKGKIVTTLDLKRPKKAPVDQVVEETDTIEAKKKAMKAAYQAERYQLLGFAVLLFGAVAAVLGGMLATGPLPLPRKRWLPAFAS